MALFEALFECLFAGSFGCCFEICLLFYFIVCLKLCLDFIWEFDTYFVEVLVWWLKSRGLFMCLFNVFFYNLFGWLFRSLFV